MEWRRLLRKIVNVRVANKSYNIRGHYVVLKVEYLWNIWVKRDGVKANLFLSNWLNFKYSHWFCLWSSFKYRSFWIEDAGFSDNFFRFKVG